MRNSIVSVAIGTLALAIASTLSHAAAPLDDSTVATPDMPRHSASALGRLGVSIGPVASIAGGPTDADVGDSDSFGRNLQWLGLTDMLVILSSDCTGTVAPAVCQTLAPAPGVTSFSFQDVGRIALPKNAANSLLCYWLSPLLTVTYSNPTASNVVARLNVSPTLTVENAVLSTPGLIDPTTGVAFNGQLVTGMTSSQRFEIPLPAGITISERKRDSAVCIAGFLSRKTLTETFGLTDAQAKDFFKKATTVHLNLSGSAQYVSDASLYFGFRIIGD
jgi:hypothetical protein